MKKSDLNHHFPKFEKLSRLLPGEEKIRENILVDSPISGPPCGTVKTLYDALHRAASLTDNGQFLGEFKDGKYQFTAYDEVIKNTSILGSAMLAVGEKPGGRAGVAGIHSARYITSMHAMVAFNLTIVPLYHNSKLETLCEIAKNCDLSLILCDNADRANRMAAAKTEGLLPSLKTLVVLSDEKVDNISADGVTVYCYEDFYQLGVDNPKEAVPPKPDDIYLICHTSGTTGRPKGVMMSHKSLLAAMAGLYTQWVLPPHRFIFDQEDVYFSFLSLAHVYEHLMQAFVIYIGGSIGVYGGDVNRLVADIQCLKPTILSLVPRLLNRFYDHIHAEVEKKSFLAKTLFSIAKKNKLSLLNNGQQRYDTIWDKLIFNKLRPIFGGRLRMITTGGAPVTPAVKEFTRIAYGCPLMEGYGQTECAAAGTLNLPFEFLSGPVGAPAPWAQIKLVDVDEMNYFAKDDKGEICFRGAAVMTGYFNDPELTAKTVDSEGWLHTGDIGRWNEQGGLEVIDRKNAIFKMCQGDFVSPEQIETVYLNSTLLTQLFVTGRTTRSFLVGIAAPNMANLKTALQRLPEMSKKIGYSDEQLLADVEVRRWLLSAVNASAKESGLQSIELIRHIVLINQEWTAENGLVTPTLKLKRTDLRNKYEQEIEEMYKEETTL